MSCEVTRNYAGHQIVVRIAATDKPASKLYIDGKVVDASTNVTARSGSLLRGTIVDNDKTYIVEIKRVWPFANPIFYANGVRID